MDPILHRGLLEELTTANCRYCNQHGFLLESKEKIYCIRCVLSGEVTHDEVLIEDNECVFTVQTCEKSNEIRNRKVIEGEWISESTTIMASKFLEERKAYPLAFKKTMECQTCLVYPILFLSFQKQSQIQCLCCFLKLSKEEQHTFMLHLPKLPSVSAAVCKRVQSVIKPPLKTKLNRKYVAHSIVNLANSIWKRASSENQSVAVVLNDHRFLSSILDLSMIAHGYVDEKEGFKLLRYYEDTFTKEMLVPFRAPRTPQRTVLVGSDLKTHSLLIKSRNNHCHFLFQDQPDIFLIGEIQNEIKDTLFLLKSCDLLLKQQLPSFKGFKITVIPLSEKEAKPRYDWNQTSLDESYVSEQWISKITQEIESEKVVVCRPVGGDILKVLQPSPFGFYSFDGSVLECAMDGTSESSLSKMEKIVPPAHRFVHTVLKQTLQRYVLGEEKIGSVLNAMTSSVFERKENKDERLHFLMGLIQIENVPMLRQKGSKEFEEFYEMMGFEEWEKGEKGKELKKKGKESKEIGRAHV